MKVGVDLIEIARIERALERYPRFRERCFTEAERVYCDSARSRGELRGRFAGKRRSAKRSGLHALHLEGDQDRRDAGTERATHGPVAGRVGRLGSGEIDRR